MATITSCAIWERTPGLAATDGWPYLPADLIHAGKFNSPHGQAVDNQGNLYVTEWLIGGRHTKLAKTDHA